MENFRHSKAPGDDALLIDKDGLEGFGNKLGLIEGSGPTVGGRKFSYSANLAAWH
jgi:hypothetical protein